LADQKIPTWLRVTNIVLGVITIVIAILAFAFPGLAISTLVLLISLGLFLLGSARILRAVFREGLTRFLRFLNGVIGIIVLVLSAAVLILQTLVMLFLIWILSAAFLILGLGRIIVAITDKELPSWVRTLIVIVGLVTVGLSFLIFLQPALGELTLILLLAWALFLNGLIRIAKAIVGVKSA
jgi:uncharacterized membrane protein HdeD (DUF308 family)